MEFNSEPGLGRNPSMLICANNKTSVNITLSHEHITKESYNHIYNHMFEMCIKKLLSNNLPPC